MSKREKKVKAVPIWLGILVFVLAVIAGAASKTVIKPAWSKQYAVQWSDEIGTRKSDLVYGEGAMNKFDLYLPKDSSRSS